MRIRLTATAAAALAHLSLLLPAAAAGIDAEQPRAPLPFFRHGPEGFEADGVPGLPGLDAAPSARPPAGAERSEPAPPPAAPAPPPPTRAETLDRLLGRLAKAGDADEAQGIAELVQRLWMQSGSDTADLLMGRAVSAMGDGRHDVAAALLDQIIELQPGWAEGWNKRATLRFLDHDDAGSMEDISHVLALEPRHFGALSGMGAILQRHGQDKAALTAMRRALAIYPEEPDLRDAIDKLAPAVDGSDL